MTTERPVDDRQGADAAASAVAAPAAPAAPAARPRRPRTVLVVAAACVAVLGIVAAVFVATRPTASAADDGPGSVDAATSTVSRGDLTERIRLSGHLGYGEVHELGTGLGGTVTAMPAVGDVLDRGATLFRIDDRPVVLLLGDLPMWRGFEYGMDDGPDVRQLEQNLAALGFFDREPDEEFAESTAAAIERWQESLGLEETGAIEPGRIVFVPQPVRVAAHKATVGDAASAGVISVSGTEKEVLASLAPNLKEVAMVGTPVQLGLPGGETVPGTVSAVGAPAEQDDGQGGKKLKLPVTITLDDPASADGLDDVTVSGELTAVKREDALLVPVIALLARPGGGYGVELVAGGGTELVPVELGAFADGMVEVTGGELEAGDEVVVPE
ncbi:efflux RND transporter periplasmic adaptor subunit [Agromyces sp. Marseille-Q5079]|uniref:efflux RND transporter periplasmic adaptor subunit n=1 Tax=Agromyces sp. Marseille-Q5079 TaxID=3439059 RepID=UPI003D9CA185